MNKSKKDNIYFFWSASIVLCMLLAVFVLMFTSCSKPDAEGEASPPPGETDSVGTPDDEEEQLSPPASGEEPNVTAPGIIETSTPGVALLGETEDMGQEYIDKFVFLGDSTTYGLAFYDVVPKSQVWTPASGTLTLSLWSIATIVYEDGTEIPIVDAVTQKQPEYMLLTLGVNGVSFMGEEVFIQEYTNLVNAIKTASPNTKIILNSIYPVTSQYPESTGITNAKIDAANVWVEKVATDTSCKYLNTESILKDENGALRSDYDNDDNIHLSGETLKLVIQYVRTHGYA